MAIDNFLISYQESGIEFEIQSVTSSASDLNSVLLFHLLALRLSRFGVVPICPISISSSFCVKNMLFLRIVRLTLLPRIHCVLFLSFSFTHSLETFRRSFVRLSLTPVSRRPPRKHHLSYLFFFLLVRPFSNSAKCKQILGNVYESSK